MRKFVKTKSRWLLAMAVLLAALVVAVGATALRPRNASEPQEILLIATDVAFRLSDSPDANPPLRLTRGRPVRLIVRNDEPERVLHCFTIGGIGVKTTRSLAAGESETLLFTPNEAGTFAYACLMHPMMAGQIVVD